MAKNKSIHAVVAQIENRIAYGLISDIFELAACYACYIAIGHCFHDANQRTAHTAMQLVLRANGIAIEYDIDEMGKKIVAAGQGLIDEDGLASYLRSVN